MTEFSPRAVDRAIRRSGRSTVCSLAAARAGFRAAWAARDYAAIVSLAGKLPGEMLRADATILTYVENASRRLAT